MLRPILEDELNRHEFGLIAIDPAYKLLGPRDENANGEIADLMNEFEQLCTGTGAALVVAHHFAKGDSTLKEPMDRMSGAGAWARDPDSIVILTPHEEQECFTVTSILRNFPRLDDFVLRWQFPAMRIDSALDPSSLRRPQARNKVCTDTEFIDLTLEDKPKSRADIITAAQPHGISTRTVDRYLSRLCSAGVLKSSAGLYWRANNHQDDPVLPQVST